MTPDRRAEIDRKLEVVIGHALRIGVIAAAVLVLTGGAFYLAEEGSAAPDYHHFYPAARYSHDLAGIVRNAVALNSYGIIQLGLLVLIATPITRVLLAVVGFALERDLLYVIATLIVLAVLLYSFVTGGTS